MGASLIPSNRPGMLLLMKADQSFTVRITDENQCVAINRHTYKSGKTFMKSSCSGDASCPYCAVINHERYANLQMNMRPFPLGTEMCKAVYVYELKEFRLLSGWDIWQTIEQIRVDTGSVIDKDLKITRSDKGRITYHVTPQPPAPFAIDISKVKAVTPEEYMTYLQGVKLPMSVPLPVEAAPAAAQSSAPQAAQAPVAPATAQQASPALGPAAPTPAPVSQPLVPQPAAPEAAQPPAGSVRKHGQAMADKLNEVLRKHGFNVNAMNQAIARVNSDKKKVNEFIDDEVEKLIVEYQLLMQGSETPSQ